MKSCLNLFKVVVAIAFERAPLCCMFCFGCQNARQLRLVYRGTLHRAQHFGQPKIIFYCTQTNIYSNHTKHKNYSIKWQKLRIAILHRQKAHQKEFVREVSSKI